MSLSRSLPAVLVLAATPALARAQQTQATAAPTPLPVRAVTLFSSGVSYTLREGEVSGDAAIPLSFRTVQVNDILKSLVLLDEKGRVQPVTYPSRDPIGRTLSSFAVDVSEPLGRADLLNRLRGARVSIETTAKETLQGQIVGVETKTERVGEREVTVEILTVLGEAGLQSVRLETVRTIRLLDERLNREFREALGLLASGADEARRQIVLRFEGEGKRRVRVGYVSEAPLWKISYRLLLGGGGISGVAAPAGPPAKPYLQGWALVENTTDEDWQNVQLSLVSGRPVSFIQDLYQPLYLPRPVVPPDVVASPYPQLSAGDISSDKQADVAAAETAAAKSETEGAARGRANRPLPRAAPAPSGLGGLPAEVADASFAANAQLMRASVAAQATGQSAGELFRYDISVPVSLPRQQAAMIPVIAQDVEGEKLSLFNADTGPRFPLNAVRVVNNTTLHLKGGPVTLFDDGVYAGDARMEDVPPGDNRLVTYAVDLSVEGERQGTGTSTTLTTLAINRGVLIVTRRERIETKYTLKSKAAQPKTVLVEHPFNAAYTLVAPAKATERTGDRYRFAVALAPSQSNTLTVLVERPIGQRLGLVDEDINALAVYANQTNVDARLRDTLREVVQRRRRVAELQSQAANREAEIGAINQDQERVRKNMAALDKASALYKRYVAQLDQQETRIQSLRADANRLRKEAAEADRDLRAFVDKIVID